MNDWRDRLDERWSALQERWALWDAAPVVTVSLFLFLVFLSGMGWYWSREPAVFSVAKTDADRSGQVLARVMIQVGTTLHDKRGGYLRNDLLPPGLLLDNIPSWELGVLHQLRDMTRALHRDMGLSHAPYVEDKDLAIAESALNVNPESWLFPMAERELSRGSDALAVYNGRLGRGEAHFNPRIVYLQRWLMDVDASLGLLSTRLNSALPDHAVLSGVSGVSALPDPGETAWADIDNVFYEARGSAWALLHLLKAMEVEFGPELERRHSLLSLRAAIHELEATQQPLWSPVILNGSGFGLFANHSLILANYLNRAQFDLAGVRISLLETE